MGRPGYVTPPELVLPVQRHYGPAGRCAECAAVLSIYNPYTVCGPCRLKLAEERVAERVDEAETEELLGNIWHAHPRREQVRTVLPRD